MKHKHKKKKCLFLLLAALLVAAFFLLRGGQGRAANYSSETARAGSISAYYSFSGQVTVKDLQAVSAKTGAVVRDVYVRLDQLVDAGDPLVRLSNGDILRAAIRGEVTELYVAEGDSVSAGAQLMSIVNFDDLQVVVKIDEYDIRAVQAGMEATATINALSISYGAKIEHISKQAMASGDVNYYEAKLAAPTNENVLPGMKVDVRVLSQHTENAVLIPMASLRFDSYNAPYVYVKDGAGKIVTRPVEVGIQDGTSVEITSGLSAGEMVYKPVSTNLFSVFRGVR